MNYKKEIKKILGHKDVLKKYRFRIENSKGQKQQIIKTITKIEDSVRKLEMDKRNINKAKIIILTVSEHTQKQLELHISKIVSLAMASVFKNPYQLKLIFKNRRGKTEADILFYRNKKFLDPITSSGGGVVDIASFALLISLWSLSFPNISNTLIFDEPFKFLSKEYQTKATKMVQRLTKELGLQIIMISHNKTFILSADRVFTVRKDRKSFGIVSKVEME